MQSSLLDGQGLHVALIPDGNGRWATRRGLPRRAGHLAGLRRVEESVRAAADLGISVLSLFAFSRLNWRRPDPEVRFLMRVFRRFFRRAARACPPRGIRVVGIGRRHRLPTTLRDALDEAEAATERQAGMILRVAVDYSSRDAIREAATRIAGLPEVPPDVFSRLLADPGPAVPDVDLLVRTGGEYRLSDFLLFEAAQAELVFLPTLWPDFRAAHLRRSLAAYHRRERRLGAVGSAR